MGATLNNDGTLAGLNNQGLQRMEFTDLLQKAAENHKYILVSDSHDEGSIVRNVISPESIQEMQKAGVKHLVVEISKDDQDLFDGYATGRYSDQQIREAFSIYSNSAISEEDRAVMAKQWPATLKAAKEAGIKIHCADLAKDDPRFDGMGPDAALNKFNDALGEYFRQNDDGRVAYLNQLEKTHPGITDRVNANAIAGLQTRYTHDKDIVANVKTLDGKTVVFYGSEHLTRPGGIKAQLGDDASLIMMHESTSSQEVALNHQFMVPAGDAYVFYNRVDKVHPFSGAGKLDPLGEHSAVCKAAVDMLKDREIGNMILGCVAPDANFEAYADQANAVRATQKPKDQSQASIPPR